MPNIPSNRKPVLRIVLFLACAIVFFLVLNTLYSFVNTLRRLDAIEAERDQWQRPSEILHALDLREGNIVGDLGAGSGYFSLKLAPVVGTQGQVLAVDLRKLSLFFLWTRAMLRGQHSVHAILDEEDDPRLPANSVDAILICNTYHEFTNPEAILKHVRESLRAGGRLIVVDRAPRPGQAEHGHEVAIAAAEDALRLTGFRIVSHDETFIDRSGDDHWWLVTARKP